jgi:predicted RNA-binding protein YlqC (UPF0109 family)
MIEFTRRIAKALVDAPEKVVVTEVRGGQTTLLKIGVGPGEAGKIIGKNGRTIGALRPLLNAIAAKERRRVVVEVDGSFKRVRRIETQTPVEVTASAHWTIRWPPEASGGSWMTNFPKAHYANRRGPNLNGKGELRIPK